MIELTPDEARVLGVLVEKATTTPDQYPLSLNAVVNGANQKNNRDPVMTMDENQAFEALEGLRAKGLVVRSDMAGSRVNKFKHNAVETLRARPGELAVLAELLLRGPQTLGELRGRASRMAPLESLEVARNMLAALMTREEPLVRQLPPSPGSRAERYMQLLCPEAHAVDEAEGSQGDAGGEAAGGEAAAGVVARPAASAGSGGLAQRVEKLEAEVATLRAALRRLAESLGEADPTAEATANPGPPPGDAPLVPSPGTPGEG